MEVLNSFLKPGPLDNYRKLSSFDWKKLRIELETEEIIRYKDSIVKRFKENPIFYDDGVSLDLNKTRELNYMRLNHFHYTEEADLMQIQDDLYKQIAFFETTLNYDPAFSGKLLISKSMFAAFLLKLGSQEQFEILLKIINGEYLGCFCMTEIGHGSNTKAIRTTATYNPQTKGFVLNSPDFEAAKCWAGNLGQTATHTLLFAQLYTPDGICHGVHQFVIQIRDEKTLLPFPGVIVGDMGEKMEMNGLDNGFMMFDKFHVDRSCLLNKYARITEDGVYEKSASAKPFAASLAVMSISRVSILFHSNPNLIKGITIALRYAGVRRQGGRDDDSEEIPILEYPLHQYRLIPYLACAYVFKVFAADLYITTNRPPKYNEEDSMKFGYEVHALSCAAKAEASWITQTALQECREACGGHGYLRASALGVIKNINDPSCTYEGDNNVIIQQTSNWLLKLWPMVMENKPVDHPLGSTNFLNMGKSILMRQFNEASDITSTEEIYKMYEWLITYLLKTTYENYMHIQHAKGNEFDAKCDVVAFYAKPLSKAYIHYFMLKRFHAFIDNIQDQSAKIVVRKLASLYGLFNIEKFVQFLYQGGYLKTFTLQSAIMKLCADLKNDSISLVDAIAPDDFLINSILGCSDGDVYKHMQNAFYKHEPFKRPNCWKEIVTKSKL